MLKPSETLRRRQRLEVTGIVQGVGFRPLVFRLARRHHLGGWVCNTSHGVELEVEGPPAALEAFIQSLWAEAPALARVDKIRAAETMPRGEEGFIILPSRPDPKSEAVIPADVALCDACAREIRDPHDRRYGYPFTNCTNCGPRFTLITAVPYDRANTTMAAFTMCAACRREYHNPEDRRFHAEPTACPACGPHLWLEQGGRMTAVDTLTALKEAAQLLRQGKVLAIKGLGGFHLACDARQAAAVDLLRRRKGRGDKPFAVMVRDLAEAESLAILTPPARRLLLSPESPIVLVPRRPQSGLSETVAPGNKLVGLLLPYTPLHLLLLAEAPPALVMTSGNLSEEPLEFTNAGARTRLAGLADAFLLHNRDIHIPCDDSVVRPTPAGTVIPVRRARGYVPQRLPLPVPAAKTILAVGAEQKSTFCLAWDDTALLSQHLGDLKTVETYDYFRLAVRHFQALCRQTPTIVVHDLHPHYLSTRYALELPGVQRLGVQHHHAHLASCLAEHGRRQPCLGLALDGAGYGPDGTVWGGEILVADLTSFIRVGHLAPVRLPGGEAAIKDPRKMAVAYLYAAFGSDYQQIAAALGLDFPPLIRQLLERQLTIGWQAPLTTSAGRLFDAVAAALGVCRRRTYEGQPALELEMAADEQDTGLLSDAMNTHALFWDKNNQENSPVRALPASPLQSGQTQAHQMENMLILDTISLFRAAVAEYLAGTPVPQVAARFHHTLAHLLARACEVLRDITGLNLVALSGGVCQNALLLTRLQGRLEQLGFEVLSHRLVPPNDGGLSLGQAAIAAARLGAKGV